MPSSSRSRKMPDGVPSANTDAPSTTIASASKPTAACGSTIRSLVVAMVATFVAANTATTTSMHPSIKPSIVFNHPCFLRRVISVDDSKSRTEPATHSAPVIET